MRALRIGLIVLIVLAGLFVAADRVALMMAEDEAAKQIKDSQNVAEARHATVSIQGFPFLTQVAAKELDQVDAELSGMTAQAGDSQVTITRITARLTHVQLGADFSSATASQATGKALISYDDISNAAEKGVKVSWGGRNGKGEGQVKVTAGITIPVLGRTFERSVRSTVSLKGGDTVELRADKVPGTNIPGVEKAVRDKIDFDRRIKGLPSGLKLDRIEATEDGIAFAVRGTDVKLGG